MKYRILLTGKASSVIDDFFRRSNDDLEIMTTSLWHEDILKHVKYFQPQLFVYCMYNESREEFNKMVSLKYQLDRSRVYFCVIGSQTDCTEFERAAVNVSDLILVKPLTIETIQERIINFLQMHFPVGAPVPNTAAGGEAPPASPADGPSYAVDLSPGFPGMFQESKRPHILVVDDDPRMLKMLKEELHFAYDVGTAINGKIAMKFLENKHTDLILLDYEMPAEKGPEVLEKIRANVKTKDVPVIFLTGVTEKEKIQKALVLQPQGYLLKPINRERLMETITKVLEG